MKRIGLALIALTLAVACTRSVPPQSTIQPPASNIAFHEGYLIAEFEGGEQAAIYFKNGASVSLPAKGQFEIEGTFFVDALGWSCIDNKTGDYIVIRRSGFASGKVNGMAFNLMPTESGTAFANKKTE